MDRVNKNQVYGTKYLIHFMGWTVGENERIQVFFLRSSEFSRSEFVELRTKVHRLDEGYVCVPKMMGFTEDSKENIWGNQRFWA